MGEGLGDCRPALCRRRGESRLWCFLRLGSVSCVGRRYHEMMKSVARKDLMVLWALQESFE